MPLTDVTAANRAERRGRLKRPNPPLPITSPEVLRRQLLGLRRWAAVPPDAGRRSAGSRQRRRRLAERRSGRRS